jgi:probable HAF family extracellular repeat protein
MEAKKIALAAAFVIALSSLVLAQGTYTQIDVPGAIDTYGNGIDSAGDIVGSYIDSSFNYHGFLLSNGTYTTLNYPGASYTFPLDINDKGQIAGYAVGSSQNVVYGFFYDVATQTFTTLSDPNEGKTEPCCINNSGFIGGTVYPNNGPFGFSLIGSTYELLMPPGTVTNSVIGVTAAGEFILSGTTSSSSTLYFSYFKGDYSQITLPSKPQIQLFGVNPQGTAYVGAYQQTVSTADGYVYDVQTSKFVAVEFPGETITNAEGINRHGEVVGVFTDASNHTHAFTFMPTGEAN